MNAFTRSYQEHYETVSKNERNKSMKKNLGLLMINLNDLDLNDDVAQIIVDSTGTPQFPV